MSRKVKETINASWRVLGPVAFASAALLPTLYQLAVLTQH